MWEALVVIFSSSTETQNTCSSFHLLLHLKIIRKKHLHSRSVPNTVNVIVRNVIVAHQWRRKKRCNVCCAWSKLFRCCLWILICRQRLIAACVKWLPSIATTRSASPSASPSRILGNTHLSSSSRTAPPLTMPAKLICSRFAHSVLTGSK